MPEYRLSILYISGQHARSTELSELPESTRERRLGEEWGTIGHRPSVPMPHVYDVFLSHNSADKAAVEEIATWLRDEVGLRPFLDKWHLVPGEPWIPAIERAIEGSATVAMFFGPAGGERLA